MSFHFIEDGCPTNDGGADDIAKLINRDVRHSMFRSATRFVDYEMIHGDILEFGVYTGRSLALLAFYHELNRMDIHKLDFVRRIVGFDSFEGLPTDDSHPRWKPQLFNLNHSYHPICKQGEKVTPQVVYSLFDKYKLPPPVIETGIFEAVLPALVGTKYTKAAIVHIDCDLYQSTKTVLKHLHGILQEGTVLLFDDWFNFNGRKDKGEQRAFHEYMYSQDKWCFVEYQAYATFGKSFVVNAV